MELELIIIMMSNIFVPTIAYLPIGLLLGLVGHRVYLRSVRWINKIIGERQAAENLPLFIAAINISEEKYLRS